MLTHRLKCTFLSVHTQVHACIHVCTHCSALRSEFLCPPPAGRQLCPPLPTPAAPAHPKSHPNGEGLAWPLLGTLCPPGSALAQGRAVGAQGSRARELGKELGSGRCPAAVGGSPQHGWVLQPALPRAGTAAARAGHQGAQSLLTLGCIIWGGSRDPQGTSPSPASSSCSPRPWLSPWPEHVPKSLEPWLGGAAARGRAGGGCFASQRLHPPGRGN